MTIEEAARAFKVSVISYSLAREQLQSTREKLEAARLAADAASKALNEAEANLLSIAAGR